MNQAEMERKSAYEVLRPEILYGELMPGDRLQPSELRARYHFGLSPIRDALTRLSGEGLVRHEPNKGMVVCDVTLEELADLYATRRELEASCLRSAMQNRTPEWEAEILRNLHVLNRAPTPRSAGDREEILSWEVKHNRFHRSLLSACDSPWRLRLWDILADNSARYRKLRLASELRSKLDFKRDTASEHEAIASAVVNNDVKLAHELLDQHLEHTEEAAAQVISQMKSE